jgi:dipeptidyl-peptidase-4
MENRKSRMFFEETAMSSRPHRCRFHIIPLLMLIPLSALLGQEPERLTVEWICSPEAKMVASTPSFTWLDDGSCVLYDQQKPEAERTLERLDPGSGSRRPLVDSKKALASLGQYLGGSAPRTLPFPIAIDKQGERALYLFEKDIFLLDMGTAAFRRVTTTGEEEKCVSFSPDGRKIGFVRSNDLFVYDIQGQRVTRLTQEESDSVLNGTLSWVYWEEVFGRHDTGYWWSPDSKAIAYFRTDESGVSIQHYVDTKPWTPRVLTQRYPKVGQKNPVVRVGIVEIDSRKTTWVDFKNHPYEYIVRAQWLPDSKRLSVQTLNRPQTELDLFFADRLTGAAEPILKETDSAWVNVLDDLVFLKDEERFVWGSERDGYHHLYLYTMHGGLVRKLTDGPWAVRSAGGGVAWLKGGVVGVDEKKELVYFTALEKSSIERHLYSVRFSGRGLTRLTTEDGTHSVTFSPDMRYYLDRYSSASALPSLRLCDRSGKQRLLLAGSRPEMIAKFDLQYPSFFTIPARDGFQMPAQIVKPAQLETGKKYPVIFYVYSGPSAPVVANAWQREVFWENLLLQNGYLVVRCDNRSATGISKKLETTVLYRLEGKGELNDLVDAVRWVKAQPYVDSSRIGIWGWSGGGSCTLLGMSRSTEFKAGIAVAGVSDFRFYDTKWAEQVMKTEETNRTGYEETSLLRYAKDLHGKLLLVHGTYDDNVHIQNTWSFADSLIVANKRFEMMIYPMRKHGISDLSARIHLYSTMMDFWKRNL